MKMHTDDINLTDVLLIILVLCVRAIMQYSDRILCECLQYMY